MATHPHFRHVSPVEQQAEKILKKLDFHASTLKGSILNKETAFCAFYAARCQARLHLLRAVYRASNRFVQQYSLSPRPQVPRRIPGKRPALYELKFLFFDSVVAYCVRKAALHRGFCRLCDQGLDDFVGVGKRAALL